MKQHPSKPRRLANVFQSYGTPLYFVTFCTFDRKPVLATDEVHRRFERFALNSLSHGVAVGRYVIMPDHLHCFIRIAPDKKLGVTIRLMKRSLSSAINEPMPHWQPGFFDHLVRHGESYAQKWSYVRENPVRAGLVKCAEDWPYQGEITPIQY